MLQLNRKYPSGSQKGECSFKHPSC